MVSCKYECSNIGLERKKMRVEDHPILGKDERKKKINIYVDDKLIQALEGDTIAAALLAQRIRINRYTKKKNEPRGLYCGIGRCTDCIMIVNGIPNIRTCVTFVEEGMKVETLKGLGQWKKQI
jgi:predicted molibdopterin-dependent oxidoreductase YjgC